MSRDGQSTGPEIRRFIYGGRYFDKTRFRFDSLFLNSHSATGRPFPSLFRPNLFFNGL